MPIVFELEALLNKCRYEATRSGGKGGQNVNKVSTKVILLLNVLESKVLNEDQKAVLMNKLASRISKEGILRISSGVDRTQLGNRKKVTEKFYKLIGDAFYTEEERIATKLPAAKKVKRKILKKEASEKKASRSLNWDDSDEINS